MKLTFLLISIFFFENVVAQNTITVASVSVEDTLQMVDPSIGLTFTSIDIGFQNFQIFKEGTSNIQGESLNVYGVTFSFPIAWRRRGFTETNFSFLLQHKSKGVLGFSNDYKMSGYQIGLDLFGHIFPYDSRLHVVTNLGLEFGRKVMVKEIDDEELLKYMNPFSAVTCTIQPEYVSKIWKIGIRGKAQFDFSKNKWKHKNGDVENLGGFRATGLTVVAFVGIRI